MAALVIRPLLAADAVDMATTPIVPTTAAVTPTASSAVRHLLRSVGSMGVLFWAGMTVRPDVDWRVAG
ncbi:hypothetical protein GCM10027610_068490 [Dactylosporangium cerinum]